MNWGEYTKKTKKAMRRSSRAIERLKVCRTHKEQIHEYRQSKEMVERYITAINAYQPEEPPEYILTFIDKHRKKAEAQLNTCQFHFPDPGDEGIERLDYHTSKRYK